MGALHHFQPAPPAAISRVLATFGRAELAGFIEVAIGLLDLAEPDPDDADFRLRSDGLPGDPDDVEANGDDQGDVAWIEWKQRGRHKLDAGMAERMARHKDGTILREDDEDDNPREEDDPSGQCDEDDVNTWGWPVRQALAIAGPGCQLSDPHAAPDDI